MAFDPIHFETTLVEIERYLGYLRGNDVAWEYLQQFPIEFPLPANLPDDGEGVLTFPVDTEEDYRFPCPDGQYAVNPQRVMLGYISTTNPDDFTTVVKQVQAEIDQVWNTGPAWASGIADYVRSVCDPFTRVDVAALSEEVRLMQGDVVDKILLNESNDGWAAIGEMYGNWTGDHVTAFQNFYTNYNDVEARYGRYLSEVTKGFAMFAGLAGATQLGAQKFTDELLDALKAQLAQWAAFHGKPGSVGGTPPWVADIPGVAESLLGLASLLPVVGPAAGGIKSGISLAKQVYGLLDKYGGEGDIPSLGKKIPVETAEELYTGLTDTLYTDYFTAYQDALDTMDGGASSGTVDGDSLESQTFSAAQLVKDMKDADGGWESPVDPGSLVGQGDQY